MKQVPLTLRRWTRSEYDRLVNLGVLHGEPVELVGGHLIVAEPRGSYHASALGAAQMFRSERGLARATESSGEVRKGGEAPLRVS